MDGILGFGATLLTMLRDILPIAAILFGFQALVLRRKIKAPAQIAMGMVLVLLGLSLFLEGLETALFPIGRLMAQQLTAPEFIYGSAVAAPGPVHWLDFLWIYAFAGAIGFSAAIAEPALMAVAIKANQVSGGTITVRGLRFAVAMGAAVGVAVGAFRIVTGMPLQWLIICGYVVVLIQTLSAPRAMIPLAYDSGGVTTSTVTVPLVVALGLGLAEAIPGRSPMLDGFGMIASTCLFPIIAVMAYAQLGEWQARRLKKSSEQE